MVRILPVVSLVLVFVAPTEAKDPPKVPARLHNAIKAYLEADAKRESAALKKVTSACKGDVRLAAEALRTLPPLTKAKPGVKHGLEFESGGRTFTYSIRLPKGYDGKQRFPVLVLPDHGSVDPESGIGFWDGKEGADAYVLFRPTIVKFKDDRTIFPDGQFFAIDQALALVMSDALTHLRLYYAVDPERFSMTGLSQAGYYTWYYAVSFPDEFAAIVPESAGGIAVRAAVLRLAPNLKHVHVRILHHPDDQVTPYADATNMKGAIETAGGTVELISYTDADYGGTPFPKRHPGPHHLRLSNVLPWAHTHTRTVPQTLTRVIRYHQQGSEGRWFVPPPVEVSDVFTVTCTNDGGTLSADRPGVTYLVSPEDVASKRTFKVGKKRVKPKADLQLMFELFKASGDRGRLVAATIEVTAD